LLVLSFACLGGSASGADTAPPADNSATTYIGTGTRFGIGYDSKTKLRGDIYHIFTEDKASSWIGEGWVTDQAGGVQLNYHWLPASAENDAQNALVRKLFAAFDQNQQHDRKVTLGWGFENERWFGNGYLSHGITGRRVVSDLTTSTVQTLSGTDNGRAFLQDETTATRVQIFERAYDYGVGIRGGHFYEAPQLRVTLGADYEWGLSSSKQTTVSLNLEKFFTGTPHSLAFYAEGLRKSGEFEIGRDDHRVGIIYRYELGGQPYRAVHETRAVRVEASAPVANVSTTASIPSSAPPTPARGESFSEKRTEKRMVKTTASVASDTFFDFDRATLRPDAKVALSELVAKLKQAGIEGNVHVAGHTCNIGSAQYNQKLSERRAETVKKFLVDSGAISADRVLGEGMGLRNPRYPNNKEGRPKNRRVDIEFVTFENKEETITLPAAAPAPEPAPLPALAPVPTAKPAVEWRREVIESEPAWMRRALRNTAQHKQTVDVYRQQESSVSVTRGDRRFINRAPIAQDDTFSVEQNSSSNVFNVLANDTDPDGDALTINTVTPPAHGSAVIAAGKVNYTPAAGYLGPDSFTYTIADGKGGTATATVRVTVVLPNRPPIANNDLYLVHYNTPLTADVLTNDSDPDGDPLTIVSFTQGVHGAVTRGANNMLIYTATLNYTGLDSFTYTISDGRGGTATATVNLLVDP
jgi:outer membrane protein OmpA-like peptidoglycan-associated protein